MRDGAAIVMRLNGEIIDLWFDVTFLSLNLPIIDKLGFWCMAFVLMIEFLYSVP